MASVCICGLVCIFLIPVVVLVVFSILAIMPYLNLNFNIRRLNLIQFYNLIVGVLTTTLVVFGALIVFMVRSYYAPYLQVVFVKSVVCLAFYGTTAIIASMIGVLLDNISDKISAIIFLYVVIITSLFLLCLFKLCYVYLGVYLGYIPSFDFSIFTQFTAFSLINFV